MSLALARYAAMAPVVKWNVPKRVAKASKVVKYIRKSTTPSQRAWAAKKIGRFVRNSYRRKHPKNFGEKRNVGTGKIHRGIGASAQLATRTKGTVRLDEIPHNSANFINQRERNIAYVSGIRICANFYNQNANILYLNCAVIVTKGCADNEGTLPNEDFFRSMGGSERTVDFGTALTGLDFHCLPINTDKYHVLRHRRYKLARMIPQARGVGTDNDVGNKNYMTIKWWIPIKKQLRWQSTGSTYSETAIWFVYWCDNQFATSLSAPVSNVLLHNVQNYAYFRESK